ncbi:MAG: LarC family nickel insertion protein [Alphaproteobacteria bacterium]|nr:LarC family nickel insertion protein [Alphaproteobacteria bacterium]
MSEQVEGRGGPVTAIHLDAVGGVAGDMFAAALLDVRPDLWPDCEGAIAAMDLPATVQARWEAHGDGTLSGARFMVAGAAGDGAQHTHWRRIRDRLTAAALAEPVREVALSIFGALAEAEAAVHGIAVDEVAFHEVGAEDSIVDIVSAAALIAALGPCRWSIGPIPRGRGQVRTAHGILPVPAPATLELLKGFLLFDDGEDGERVTPTGAAILHHLQPTQAADPLPRKLLGAGLGFGGRRLAGRSNVLRATLYAAAGDDALADRVEVLRCEVDDQTAEDLAVALDHLRGIDGVIDVCQWPVLAKKGRLATALQVLATPAAADRAALALLDETATLGVRRASRSRTVVARQSRREGDVRVKLARRPSGTTAKAEIDDLAGIEGAGARRAARRRAEAAAMADEDGDGR